MTDRWQDDPDRAPRVAGLLREVERFRRQLQAAEAIAAAGNLDGWMQRRADERVPNARKGLDAAIGMALFDEAGPPDDAIAEAAGVDVEHVAGVRERLRSFGR